MKQRARAGKTETVQPLEADTEPASASNVVDLTELLRKSLSGHGARGVKKAAAAAKKKTAPRKRA